MRSFRTLPILVVLLAALGLVGTACTGTTPPAMTVSGRVYSQEQLFKDLAKANPTAKAPTEYTTAEIAQQLTLKAQEDLIATALVDRNIEVTAQDRELATTLRQSSQSGGTASDTDAAQVALARVLGEEAQRRGEGDLDGLALQLYEKAKDGLGTPAQECISAVVVVAGTIDPQTGAPASNPTAADVAAAKAKAAEAKAKLDAGTPMAEVAAQYSAVPADQTTACINEGEINPTFAATVAALQPGKAADPLFVEAQGAVFVIRLDSRTPATPAPPFEQVKGDYLATAKIQLGFQQLTTWYREAARTADISVNPRFGRWDVERGEVVPPEGAAQPTVPTTDLSQLLGSGAPTELPTTSR